MKKLFALALSVMMMLSLAACGGSASSDAAEPVVEGTVADAADVGTGDTADAPETVTITSLNADGEPTQLEVPYDPQRLAVMDLAVLDMLDNFGVGDRVVGVSKGSSIDYLQSYVTDDSILNLGTIKEADLEAVMESEPDVIFIGGRLSSIYDQLSEIAPVVYLATDVSKGVVASTSENAMTVASLFGVEDTVSGLLSEYDERISALAEVAEGSTAAVGMVTSGSFNVLGNDGRCSIIGVEIGFENVGLEAASGSTRGGGEGGGQGGGSGEGAASGSGEGRGEGGGSEAASEATGGATATHGNEASFEVLVSLNPDYIFVMDRDAAIGTEGAQMAQEVMENELVMKTDAYQNSHIVYLAHSNVWYTAEGGITALGIMLSDLESALL